MAKDFSASIDARTTITWDKIVERMVAYCKAHNFDSDESTCILVCQTLTNHVRRVRSDEHGVEMDVEDLDDIARLEEHVMASDMIVIFLTRTYIASANCRREVFAAVQQRKPS